MLNELRPDHNYERERRAGLSSQQRREEDERTSAFLSRAVKFALATGLTILGYKMMF